MVWLIQNLYRQANCIRKCTTWNNLSPVIIRLLSPSPSRHIRIRSLHTCTGKLHTCTERLFWCNIYALHLNKRLVAVDHGSLTNIFCHKHLVNEQVNGMLYISIHSSQNGGFEYANIRLISVHFFLSQYSFHKRYRSRRPDSLLWI